MPKWKKGQSGNPNGRPPKIRSLTLALKDVSEGEVYNIKGKSIRRKDLLAEMIWQSLLEGKTVFSDGRVLPVEDTGEWVNLVKFVFTQIDGPPVKQEHIQVTTVNPDEVRRFIIDKVDSLSTTLEIEDSKNGH